MQVTGKEKRGDEQKLEALRIIGQRHKASQNALIKAVQDAFDSGSSVRVVAETGSIDPKTARRYNNLPRHH